jgi:hypothetical protein
VIGRAAKLSPISYKMRPVSRLSVQEKQVNREESSVVERRHHGYLEPQPAVAMT